MRKNKNLYAVIIAGGVGSRFWPLSRKEQPKQFLDIVGKATLFEQTLTRVKPLVDPSHIIIVTGRAYKGLIAKAIKPFGIPGANVLLEPNGKNTAPAVCWAAAHCFQKNPQAIMAVLPADHLIGKPQAFVKHIQEAVVLADQQYLVTMGIVPTRAEIGYGYIQSQTVRCGKKTIRQVQRFTEKPTAQKARAFIKNKAYFWNSGMFVWRADEILTEFAIHQPQIYDVMFGKSQRQILQKWSGLPSISIDYGILEKAERVAVIPAGDMQWSDLGSWEALVEVMKKDKQGNLVKGKARQLGCQNTAVFGGKRFIAAIGLEDIVIVDSPDALLVCRKDQSQRVKEIAAGMKKKV